jgi:dCMP deaminase
MKTKYKLAHMRAAHLYADLSTARRLKVGAIIVKEDRIISIGYNGMPSGWDNNCEYEHYTLGNPNDFELKTRPEVLHAETNAIAKLARSSESGLDADLFVTHSPCLDCAKIIYQSGIRRVFYANAYRDTAGVDFLQASGVEVEQVNV